LFKREWFEACFSEGEVLMIVKGNWKAKRNGRDQKREVTSWKFLKAGKAIVDFS
jgi:hypothetical protein